MINLYLMQHGEAVSKDVDPESPLTKLGRTHAERIADFLKSAGVSVDYVFHSDRLRAKQTAEIVASAILEQGKPQFLQGLGPLDPIEPIMEAWGAWDGPVLLVGHLPLFNKLVSKMIHGDAEQSVVNFETASILCLERLEGLWRLGWFLRPHLLKEH